MAQRWMSEMDLDSIEVLDTLADLLATVRAEGVKAERAAVVAHMRKVTLPFREREEKTLHDMAGVIESGLFHVTPREAEEGKGT